MATVKKPTAKAAAPAKKVAAESTAKKTMAVKAVAPAVKKPAPARPAPAKAVARPEAAKKPAVKAVGAKAAPVKPVSKQPAPVKVAPTKPVAAPAAPKTKSMPEKKATHASTAAAAPAGKKTSGHAVPAKPAPAKSKKAAHGVIMESELLKMSEDEYMNEAQLEFFRARLRAMKDEIIDNARETGEHLKENEVFADPNDRATVEEENMLEQRVRDRERKLLKKIDQSLARIEAGEYGYCLETGDPIGIPRLLARPTAELSIEAQEKHERMEKLFAD